MRELLERWAKVEPERAAPLGGVPGVFSILDGRSWWSPDQEGVAGDAFVLAATIEAVEARGLEWDLTVHLGTYGSRVWSDPSRETANFTFGSGPSPAAALLSAYLNAIEAT